MYTSKTVWVNMFLEFQATRDMGMYSDKIDSKQETLWLCKDKRRNFCSYKDQLQADLDSLLSKSYSKPETESFRTDTCTSQKCFLFLSKSLDNYDKYLCNHSSIHSFHPNKHIVLGMAYYNK